MFQIQQENASIPLNLVYGNNHFEHVNIYSKITNIPIYTHNDDKKKGKTTNHNMDVNNETKICDKKNTKI